jgi:NTP pyrophosphatase (non-canonical NTP hydrolase)
MTSSVFEYVRQLTLTDRKSLAEKGLKTAEEVGELAKVILPYVSAASTTHRFVPKERILEEVSDVILCALSIAYELGYDDDSLHAMMMHKAKYWDELQHREIKAAYPIPYEIHITVREVATVDEFKAACAALSVKPILLDLHTKTDTMIRDMMTSSVHIGDNTTAYAEMKRISAGMTAAGYDVIREKIETVPWHPSAPSTVHSNPVMPKDCYFEAHFNIVVTDETLIKLRHLISNMDVFVSPLRSRADRDALKVESLRVHLSRNVFKKVSENEYVIMATLRRYSGTYEAFADEFENTKKEIEQYGFSVLKTITEFSVYDSKISHDSEWLSVSVVKPVAVTA